MLVDCRHVRSSCIQSAYEISVSMSFKFFCSRFAHQIPTLVCRWSLIVSIIQSNGTCPNRCPSTYHGSHIISSDACGSVKAAVIPIDLSGRPSWSFRTNLPFCHARGESTTTSAETVRSGGKGSSSEAVSDVL